VHAVSQTRTAVHNMHARQRPQQWGARGFACRPWLYLYFDRGQRSLNSYTACCEAKVVDAARWHLKALTLTSVCARTQSSRYALQLSILVRVSKDTKIHRLMSTLLRWKMYYVIFR
jgi:hypothetical protein